MKETDNAGRAKRAMQLWFGIFMVLVYVGVGLLFIINFFEYFIASRVISYCIGGLLCVYGLWRGYRLYKGWY